MKQIIIKKSYFDNIKIVLESLNDFFSSQYRRKNFPVIDSEFQIDSNLVHIISWLNNVEPTMIEDQSKIEGVINQINEAAETVDDESPFSKFIADGNTAIIDKVNAFVGYKILQFIADNFDDFSRLVNGIYTFDMFLNPSKLSYVIDKFSKPIDVSEIDKMIVDEQFIMFSMDNYISSVFESEDITFPEEIDSNIETTRIKSLRDATDITVVIDDREDTSEEIKQEAATQSSTSQQKPKHIMYDQSGGMFKISKQCEKAVNEFISGLEKVDDTKGLLNYFKSVSEKGYAGTLASFMHIPFVLAKVFANDSKYPSEDKQEMNDIKDHIKLYESIKDKNKGAVRFYNYDLFSTFKIDKKGTIDFLRNYFNLNLVNDSSITVDNNTILTIFNIYDSRVYFDALYDLLPDNIKKSKYPTEDDFVKTIRGRLNKNSHANKIYETPDETPSDNTIVTSDTISEYTFKTIKNMGEITMEDMQFCDQYAQIVHDEIRTANDRVYNLGLSQIELASYVDESYKVFSEGVIADLFNKHREKKENKNIEKIETKLGIKLHESVKKYNNKKIESDFFNLYNFNDKYIEIYNEYHYDDKYPIGQIYSSYYDGDDFIDNCDVFMDDNGYVYTNAYSKGRRKVEKVSDTLDQFISTVDDKPVSMISSKTVTAVTSVIQSDKNTNNEFEFEFDVKLKPSDSNSCTLLALYLYDAFLHDWSHFNDKTLGIPDKLADMIDSPFTWEKFKFIDINVISSENETKVIYSFKYDGEEFDMLGILRLDKSNHVVESYVQEAEVGDIPDYMKNRIQISDVTSDGLSVTDVTLPPDVPRNPITDLTESISTKINNKSNDMDTMLGSGYEDEHENDSSHKDAKIVYNITNNYSNTFNRSYTDNSTGKTINTANIKNSDRVNHKHDRDKNNSNANNSNNSRSVNSEDTKVNNSSSEEERMSNGYTFEQLMMVLEAEEPLSTEIPDANIGKPPKPDIMTRAMDVDRKTLPLQQKAKRSVQKAINTKDAVVKPIGRTKKWLTDTIDSLIKRDEDKVKAEIIENPSYRTSLYKAMRVAVKMGLVTTAFTISGYLGAAVATVEVAKIADKQRLKKEVQNEFGAELQILEDKIRMADHDAMYGDNKTEARKSKWQMMRLRSKMQQIAVATPSSKIKHPSNVI